MEKKQLRIGEITYTNCFPIYYHLRNRSGTGTAEFVPGSPARLNELLRSGKLDLCPSSSVEYARDPERYFILPRFCIASTGTVRSIRLFSRLPLEELDGGRVVLTGESATSVVLCRIILGHFLGFDNDFTTGLSDLDQALDQADAVLLIGDRALAAGMRRDRPGLYSYDMGEIWHERTGLPFVYALWTLNETVARTQADMQMLNEFWQSLCEAHRALPEADEEIISSLLRKKPFLTRSGVTEYWRLISYRLTGKHLEGLDLFYSLGHETGLVPAPPEIRFLRI
ncbi:MAG: menaquinone biosynthesis protein [Gemmatimonadota bacterium]|nr:menaquinone biosynthesis protein [Gemmatimonadota bacterium]